MKKIELADLVICTALLLPQSIDLLNVDNTSDSENEILYSFQIHNPEETKGLISMNESLSFLMTDKSQELLAQELSEDEELVVLAAFTTDLNVIRPKEEFEAKISVSKIEKGLPSRF